MKIGQDCDCYNMNIRLINVTFMNELASRVIILRSGMTNGGRKYVNLVLT